MIDKWKELYRNRTVQEDLIRREDVLRLAKDICIPHKDGYEYRHRCIDPLDVMELPSAEPGRMMKVKADRNFIAGMRKPLEAVIYTIRYCRTIQSCERCPYYAESDCSDLFAKDVFYYLDQYQTLLDRLNRCHHISCDPDQPMLPGFDSNSGQDQRFEDLLGRIDNYSDEMKDDREDR